MKATGIVRRIDELGRVVIPKEIRRTQRIRQGDALEIFTAADGQVVFKKYSPLVELGELAGVYAEVLAKNLGRPVLICDRESIVAATGTGKGQLLGRRSAMPPPGCWPCAALTPRRKPLPAALRPLTKGKRCCCASAPLWCRGMWKAVCC
mgnify:CR=1 FL=1